MRIEKDSWLLTRPIAHRGLWGNGVVENTKEAYENAAKKGYPIEIDLYSTTDNQIVSFHDRTLDRITGEKGFIYEKSLDELKKIKIKGTNESIPTLYEVLEIANGRSPLLIEFKNQPNKNYIKTAVDILKNYKGEFAVQAFDPLYLNKIRKLAPEFIRGILATHQAFGENFIKRFVLKNMSLNFLCSPDFISYNFSGLPLKKSKIKDKAILAWTVTSQEIADNIADYCDNIIFENFIPKQYK